MDKKISKKVIILHILKILEKYSSKDYPISQTAISKYLNDIDVSCDRKTVGRNVQYLIEFGYLIKKSVRGYYIDASSTVSNNDKLRLILLIENNLDKFENENILSILLKSMEI